MSQTPTSWPERQNALIKTFGERLAAARFWRIEQNGQALGLFDSRNGLRHPPLPEFEAVLKAHPFLYVLDAQGNYLATWDQGNQLFWTATPARDGKDFSLEEGKQRCTAGQWAGLQGWRLPTKDWLHRFATHSANPHRRGEKFRLEYGGSGAAWSILTAGGICDVDEGYWSVNSSSGGALYPCHPHWQEKSSAERLIDLVARGWRLATPDGKAVFAPKDLGQAPEPWCEYFARHNLRLRALDSEEVIDPADFHLEPLLSAIDYRPCRLPRLDRSQMSDPHKGLWELWGADEAWLRQNGWVARDPARDLKALAVGIDFGTSSTVVAVETEQGARELLRIGVRDFYAPIKAAHFENPTVLELLDWSRFAAVWQTEVYRPALDWDAMRAAHEAQASFRDNPGEPRVLARILPRLKQWALRTAEQGVLLRDTQGVELRLPPHQARNPVRGQPINVGPDDPFDPIELYAWYLGMAINWRGRGLFLNYYLSFPVRYPREVKERILASFRRGLQRSLPPALIASHPEVLAQFSVTELATEPAAYAAAALPALGCAPTVEGIPYAVFDFGGGTADFDFGLYRLPQPDEAEAGFEQVLEHLAHSGDNFLGGENLLEHLVYLAFQQNLPALRDKRIQFTKPIDAAPFAGSESFLAPTLAAQTNTVMLAARLRPFLEGSAPQLTSPTKLDLLDADGQRHTIELNLDASALDAWLRARIRAGLKTFLMELKTQALPFYPAGEPVHLLLAGNASRNRHIEALTQGEAWQELVQEVFGDPAPVLEVHPPLPIQEDNPHAPTAKTAVALGLLALTPGAATGFVNRHAQARAGEAPFGMFVGRIQRGEFVPVLFPETAYGHWHELGPVNQGQFRLCFSLSAVARAGLREGAPELRLRRLFFPEAPVGARLFVRAIKPRCIELAVGDLETLEQGPIQQMDLDHDG